MKSLTRIIAILALITLIISTLGCASNATKSANPYNTPTQNARSPLEAERLTLQAAEFINSDPEMAEQLLRSALSHDLYHGPAHNNLGVLYLNQNNLYEAASEFEWARKLMPGHPDPRLNLALTLETAGRIKEALATYDSALEVYPNHLPTIQALTRLQLRHNQTDERTTQFLEDIALRSTDQEWRDWAIARRLR